MSTGEGGLCELCESLLRRHRGRDEGDLHIKPHLEAVWGLYSRHGPGNHSAQASSQYWQFKSVCVVFFYSFCCCCSFCRCAINVKNIFLTPSWRNTLSTWCLTPSTPSSALRSLRTARLCRSGPWFTLPASATFRHLLTLAWLYEWTQYGCLLIITVNNATYSFLLRHKVKFTSTFKHWMFLQPQIHWKRLKYKSYSSAALRHRWH